MTETEMDDFNKIISDHGLNPEDFVVASQEEFPEDGSVGHIKRTIKVTYKETSKEKEYDASSGTSSGLDVFLKDLSEGFFKSNYKD